MKIIAEQKLRGVKLNLPDVGETTIPEDGILDLEENLAKSLVHSKMGYSFQEQSDDDSQNSEDSDGLDTKLALENLSLQELIAMAEEAGLPIEEWEKLSKNTKKAQSLMVNYLGKKLKQ